MVKFNIILSSTIIALLCIGCLSSNSSESRVDTLPYYEDANFTPKWLAPGSQELKEFHKIKPFNLINQDSLLINHLTFKDKLYVTNFFFTTCPGICPKMNDNMAILQAEFMADPAVLLLSHSVTPERDSVPVLKAYADYRNIKSNKWHIVTGSEEEIYDLGRSFYFVEEDLGIDKSIDDFLHTENFVLVDRNKHIRGIYNGLNKTAVNQLITDIRTLKKER